MGGLSLSIVLSPLALAFFIPFLLRLLKKKPSIVVIPVLSFPSFTSSFYFSLTIYLLTLCPLCRSSLACHYPVCLLYHLFLSRDPVTSPHLSLCFFLSTMSSTFFVFQSCLPVLSLALPIPYPPLSITLSETLPILCHSLLIPPPA